MTNNKNGAPVQESAVETTQKDSTAEDERGIYHPLTWRNDNPDRSHGKAARMARKQAIDRKRGGTL